MTKYDDLPRDEKTGAIQAEQVEFPVRYRFLLPIDAGGVRGVAEVEMRAPTVLDLEASDREKTDTARAAALLANLVELSPDEVRQMGTLDFSRLFGVVAAFL